MATFTKINKFTTHLAQKVHNLDTDNIYVALFQSTTDLAATSTSYTGRTNEVANGNGYTTGGQLIGATVTADDTSGGSPVAGTMRLICTTNPLWTASGAGITGIRYVVLYNQTSAGKELIGYYDYGSSVNLASGETFTVDFTTNVSILTLT